MYSTTAENVVSVLVYDMTVLKNVQNFFEMDTQILEALAFEN